MRFFKSIKLIIPLVAVGLFGVSVLVGHLISERLAYKRMIELETAKIRNRISYTQAIAEQYLQQGRTENLQKLLSSFSSEADLMNLFIAGGDGVVIISNRLAETGRHWASLDYDLPAAAIKDVAGKHDIYTLHNKQGDYIDGLTRVCEMAKLAFARRKDCGFLFYRVNLKPHRQEIRRQQNEQSVLVAIAMGFVIFLLVVFITVMITSPVLKIKHALLRFAGGKLDERVTLKGNNEVAALGYIVNDLFATINIKERLLKEKEQRLQALFDCVHEAIFTIDEQGLIQSINPASESLFGYTQDELLGQNVNMLFNVPGNNGQDSYLQNYLLNDQKNIIGKGREMQGLRKDGTVFPIHLSVSEMILEGKRYFTGIIQDFSERKKLEDALRAANAALNERAITDGLTGLYNRSHFDSTLEKELRRACRMQTPLSLLMCDIDYFKQYNDKLGHQAGDECIRQVAQIMQQIFQRGGEHVARYGGEEFVIIIPGNTEMQAKDMAEFLRITIWNAHRPHPESAVSEYVTVSIGVTTYVPTASKNKPPRGELLLELADKALYLSKQNGRNQVTQLPFSVDAASDAQTAVMAERKERK